MIKEILPNKKCLQGSSSPGTGPPMFIPGWEALAKRTLTTNTGRASRPGNFIYYILNPIVPLPKLREGFYFALSCVIYVNEFMLSYLAKSKFIAATKASSYHPILSCRGFNKRAYSKLQNIYSLHRYFFASTAVYIDVCGDIRINVSPTT